MNNNLKFPIQLKGEEINGVKAIINFLIELALCKHQYIKNHPRGNYLVWKTVWFCVVLPLFLYLALFLFALSLDMTKQGAQFCLKLSEIQTQFPLLFNFTNYINQHSFKVYLMPLLGIMSVVYWNLWKDYHSKWMYCCNVFNQILTLDENKADKLRRALAIDLLILDLWAHRSFSEFFRDSLLEALKAMKQDDKEFYIEKINRGEISECEALRILEGYQKRNGTRQS